MAWSATVVCVYVYYVDIRVRCVAYNNNLIPSAIYVCQETRPSLIPLVGAKSSQRVHHATITPLLRQNDVATSVWRNNGVVVAWCALWDCINQCQVLVWTNWTSENKLLLNFNQNSTIFTQQNAIQKMPSTKRRPFRLGVNVLKGFFFQNVTNRNWHQCWLILLRHFYASLSEFTHHWYSIPWNYWF